MHKFLFAAVVSALLLAACQSDKKSENTDAAAQLIDTATGKPIPLPNKWQGDAACDLLSDQEFYTLFQVEEKRDVANRRTLQNANYCLRTWKKPDWREREIAEEKNPNLAASPESMLVIEVLDYGTLAVAEAQFNMAKKDRLNGYATEVPGLGEGALWSDSQGLLLFKKGHLCVQIKLDHADKVSDNLPLAREVAVLALKKM
jgi:hypothetical protein